MSNMLRDILIDVMDIFSRADFQTIPVNISDNHICVYGKSEDGKVFISVKGKDEVPEEERFNDFALRSWSVIKGLINSFYSKENPDECKIILKNNSNGYPAIMKFQYGPTSFEHYVQPLDFIEKQPELYQAYKSKRVGLKQLDKDELPEFTSKMLKDAKSIGSMLSGEPFYWQNMDGKLYIAFGKENTSVDCARVFVGNVEPTFAVPTVLFDINSFINMYKCFDEKNVRLAFRGNMIVMYSDDKITEKMAILTGNAMS